MDVKSAEFVKSSPKVTDCPDPTIPEYAFIGRSNVGKSSLINHLTNRKKLAKTSSTPGKTQLINHFLINDQWYLVDLPGYGWAQTSKTNKAEWKKMIHTYLEERQNLACVFLLVDLRHDPQKIDLDFMEWLGTEGIPFSIVFTKADKLGKTQVQSNVASYKKEMRKTWEELPPTFVTSSAERVGGKEIMDFIENINAAIL
ncbi:ribosome biogenesis GTP-binding protein YihA/YsxC [Ekhidna sp.]|uniref:ribosome biogenesis GTP-binding protein YihA/YsxC n=1 Tax=Ekhidna sp. TaxID=2608089 RepID=UPI003CCC1768